MKYWKTRFKGEKSADDIHTALGRDGATVLRIHVEKGETQVYFTGGEQKERGRQLREAFGAEEPVEATADDVTRIG